MSRISIPGGGLPAFYPDATLALDFLAGAYRVGAGASSRPDFASLPNLTVTRATPSVAYGTTSAGVLVPFAANVARITDQGLLVEDARTNINPQSESDSGWAAAGTTPPTVQTNTTQSGLTCVSATFTTGVSGFGGTRAAGSAFNMTNGTTYSVSCWVMFSRQLTGSESITIFLTGQQGGWNVGPNAGNFTAGNAPLLWARYYADNVAFTAATGAQSFNIFPGANLTAPLTVYITRRQAEAGAFSSSYIPTVASSVTRAADSVSIASLSAITTGTILVSTTPLQSSTSGLVAEIGDGTANNRVGMQLLSGNQPRYFQVRSGSSEASGTGSLVTVGQTTTFALRMANNDYNAAQGGTLFGADATVTTPSGMTKLAVGSRTDGSGEQPTAYIRKLVLYPTAYSDAQLQLLTA